MPDQQSILVIFDLLNNSAPVTPGAKKTIDNISRTYPYFIPARYIKAIDLYRKDPLSPAIHSIVSGYTGNWVKFNEYLTSTAPMGGNFIDNMADPFAQTKENEVAYEKKKETSIFDEPINGEDNSSKLSRKEQNVYIPTTPIAFSKPMGDVEDAIIEEVYDTDTPDPVQSAPSNTSTIAGNAEENEEELSPEEAKRLQEEADAFINAFLAKNSRGGFVEPQQEQVAHTPESTPIEEPQHVEPEVRHPVKEEPEVIVSAPIENETVDTPVADEPHAEKEEIAAPLFTEDYFRQQGVHVSPELPEDILATENLAHDDNTVDKALMVMMSFQEWLLHFRKKVESQEQEQEGQKALKSMWQKEKLAAALEEENDEIPEEVFDLAMTSIAREDGLASESLAEIYIKQGKYDKAIEMFRKLSLRNPEKSTYFAQKIEEISKDN